MRGDVDFGNGLILGHADADAFVAKIDKTGAALWGMNFGKEGGTERGNDVALTAAGEPVVAGYFDSGLVFAGSMKTISTTGITRRANVDLMVVCSSESGWALAWQRTCRAKRSRFSASAARNGRDSCQRDGRGGDSATTRQRPRQAFRSPSTNASATTPNATVWMTSGVT